MPMLKAAIIQHSRCIIIFKLDFHCLFWNNGNQVYTKKYKGGNLLIDNLKTILQEKEVQYEIIHHEKQICAAQEGADYFGIEIGQTAPTLVLKSEKGYFAMIVSGNRGRVNLEKVSGIIGCGQLKMATPKEVR
ncbi:aminoacyl-tRNA deacylase [Clostridium sp. Marseille-QA1073]